MKNTQGLKTLGHYRKDARDPRFSASLFPEGGNTPFYDVVKIALDRSRNLILSSCSKTPEDVHWSGFFYLTPKVEEIDRFRKTMPEAKPGGKQDEQTKAMLSGPPMKNLLLFDCIQLMEFATSYGQSQSINELLTGWPERPDANIRVFTSAGLSYLEAAFDFLLDWGCSILLRLQNNYAKSKEGKQVIHVYDLSRTPDVNDLVVSPEPDIIIRNWFDDIMKGTQKWIEKYGLSAIQIEAEFNSIEIQLDHERNTWKKTSKKDGHGKKAVSGRSNLKKRGKGVLDEEVKEHLKKMNWVPGLSAEDIATAINTQDQNKYEPTSRQSLEATETFIDYQNKQKKK